MSVFDADEAPSIEHVTYGFAIKTALRRGGKFLREGQGCLVLRMPPDAADSQYYRAAQVAAKQQGNPAAFLVARVETSRKGLHNFGPVRQALARKEPAVIVVAAAVPLPDWLVAAADRVIEIGPVRPNHLVAATRQVNDQSLTSSEAKMLLAFPVRIMFAAMRRGRSVDRAIEKLATAREAKNDLHKSKALRLEDLTGYGEAKGWGLDLAIDLDQWGSGQIAWRDVDGGLLLSGPPGTGKTLFASALAETCSVELVATSLAQWQSHGHLGDMLGAMRKSFAQAIELAPCILLIDEIDSVGDRSKFQHDNASYSIQVVNALLECIDGADRREGVVIIGACNAPEQIDPALKRSGRLDRHIRISLPDLDDRKGIITLHFGDSLSVENVEYIALATDGYVGADFEKLAREARRSARRQRRSLTFGDVVQHLATPFVIEGEKRRGIAVHEAGHALVGLVLGVGVLRGVGVLKEVRGTARTPSGGALFEINASRVRDRQAYLDDIVLLLGGLAAEKVVLGTMLDGAGGGDGSDLQQAADLATMMFTQLGMEGFSYFNASNSDEREKLRRSIPGINERVEGLLAREFGRAFDILTLHRAPLEMIAQAVDKHGFLEGHGVARILAEFGSDSEARDA